MKISVLSGLFQRFSLEKTFKMVSDIVLTVSNCTECAPMRIHMTWTKKGAAKFFV